MYRFLIHIVWIENDQEGIHSPFRSCIIQVVKQESKIYHAFHSTGGSQCFMFAYREIVSSTLNKSWHIFAILRSFERFLISNNLDLITSQGILWCKYLGRDSENVSPIEKMWCDQAKSVGSRKYWFWDIAKQRKYFLLFPFVLETL